MSPEKPTKERDRSGDKDRNRVPFGGSRGGDIIRLWPEDIVVPSDPGHPLYQPGRVEEPLEDRIVDGICEVGVLQPVTVRKRDDGSPELVIGKKRVLHAREANKRLKKKGIEPKQIPCIYVKTNDQESVVRMVMENSHRKNLSPSQEAEDVRKLEVAGYDQDAIARMLGKSLDTIKNMVAVAELHDDVKAALDQEKVRLIDAVRKLGKLEKAEQPAALAKLIKENPTRKERKAAAARGEKSGPRSISAGSKAKKLVKFLDEDGAALNKQCQVLVNWLCGGESNKVLLETFPRLEKFLAGLR